MQGDLTAIVAGTSTSFVGFVNGYTTCVLNDNVFAFREEISGFKTT